jgi:hypothetical protein
MYDEPTDIPVKLNKLSIDGQTGPDLRGSNALLYIR